MRPESIATTILEVARACRAGGPPPRGLPYFGVDHPSGTALKLLDELSARGIFRKYEHVLDLGSGLGATTRYLASRLGCSATGTAPSADEAIAAQRLTARAGLEWNAAHVAADGQALPFADAAFTHVWIVESLIRLGPASRVLAEAVRVLRPGGHFGLQDLVVPTDDPHLIASGFTTSAARVDAFAAAGLVEIAVRDLTAEAGDADARTERAWRAFIGRRGPDDGIVRARHRVARLLTAAQVRVVQLTARKP